MDEDLDQRFSALRSRIASHNRRVEALERSSGDERLNALRVEGLDQRIDALRSEISSHNRRIEALKRFGDLMFGFTISNHDARRQSFYDQIRQFERFSLRPFDILRALARRGEEAIRAFGLPEVVPDVLRLRRWFTDIEVEFKDRTLAAEFVCNLHMAARWARYGFNQFNLTSDLAAGLLLTQPASLDPFDDPIRAPFPTFAITLPEGTVPFFSRDRDDTNDQRWADTIWYHEIQPAEGTDRFVQLAVAWRGQVVLRNFSPSGNLFSKEFEAADAEVVFPEDDVALDAAWRVVSNFASWLEATGGLRARRSESIPPKLAEKRRRRGEVWPTLWHLGKDVHIAPELRRAASEVALGRSARHAASGWRLRTQFIVRGHWRNQPHGPKRGERRRQWIEPFWKGPEGAEAWSHIYKPTKGT